MVGRGKIAGIAEIADIAVIGKPGTAKVPIGSRVSRTASAESREPEARAKPLAAEPLKEKLPGRRLIEGQVPFPPTTRKSGACRGPPPQDFGMSEAARCWALDQW